MKKLPALTTWSSLLALLLLTGCQEIRPSQQASGAVDRAKVAATLDKFQLVTDDSAEAFFNLSVAEMEVFNALRCERQLKQLERKPFA